MRTADAERAVAALAPVTGPAPDLDSAAALGWYHWLRYRPAARTVGFGYLQHIAALHTRPHDDQLTPGTNSDLPAGLIHSDLLIFSSLAQP